jgi:hypothetical protein
MEIQVCSTELERRRNKSFTGGEMPKASLRHKDNHAPPVSGEKHNRKKEQATTLNTRAQKDAPENISQN